MLFLSIAISCVLITDDDFEKRLEVFEEGCYYGEVVPPVGALDYGFTRSDVGIGNLDLPYDGLDTNCDGKDDFDFDGDGFVPSQFQILLNLLSALAKSTGGIGLRSAIKIIQEILT